MSINISYENGFIDINNIKFHLFNQVISSYNPITNKNYSSYDEFIIIQQLINYLDSQKDGSPQHILMNIQPYGDFPNPYTFQLLQTLEQNLENHFSDYIYNKSWNKISKVSQLNEQLEKKKLFYDVGLNPETYIKKPFEFIQTVATYLDPGPKIIDSNTLIWPQEDVTLFLNENFMKLFGFKNLNIRSVYNNNFNVEIFIDNMLITPITDYIKGNATKNQFLQNTYNISDLFKKSLIIIKELGDRLQVLLAFLWHLTNELEFEYSVITLDKVVFSFCLMLKLNVIFTGSEGEKYTIKVFEETPNIDPRTLAEKRFDKIKKEILAHNKEEINKLDDLIIRPEQPITIRGFQNTFIFPYQFYQKIRSWIENINTKLENEKIYPFEQINNIKSKTENIKNYYTIISFLRQYNDKKVLFYSNKLTNRFRIYFQSVSGFKKPLSLQDMALRILENINNKDYFICYDIILNQELNSNIIGGNPPKRKYAPSPSYPWSNTEFYTGQILVSIRCDDISWYYQDSSEQIFGPVMWSDIEQNLGSIDIAFISNNKIFPSFIPYSIFKKNMEKKEELLIDMVKKEGLLIDINNIQIEMIKQRMAILLGSNTSVFKGEEELGEQELNKIYNRIGLDYLIVTIYNDLLFQSYFDNGSPIYGSELEQFLKNNINEIENLFNENQNFDSTKLMQHQGPITRSANIGLFYKGGKKKSKKYKNKKVKKTKKDKKVRKTKKDKKVRKTKKTIIN